MKIRVLNMGKTTTGYLKEGLEEYLSRLRHYHKIEWLELSPPKGSHSLPVNVQLLKEEEVFRKQLVEGQRPWLLDAQGKEFDSAGFAEFLRGRLEGTSPLVLVTGGAYGFSPGMYALAQGRLSLSRLTFTHQMARLILAEQLYRAFTILRNEKYHH